MVQKGLAITMILLSLLIFIPSLASAETYQIKLLAASEQDLGNFSGRIANLYLELIEGSGRVFMDTVPLTKIDTQISTRFANQIACDYAKKDCSKYDFIYTIRADTSIIGGPSAGAAITLLTITALNNQRLPLDIAITGTINTGGIIGPVGAVKQKIEAAANDKINTVLIAKGSSTTTFTENNVSLNLTNIGNTLGVEVQEVATINEALALFTGQSINKVIQEIELDEQYVNQMKDIANRICDRTHKLYDEAFELNLSNTSQQRFSYAKNLTLDSIKAFENTSYYSAASFCFGANVQFASIVLNNRNITQKEAMERIDALQEAVLSLQKRTDISNKNTITALQASIIVRERLSQTQDLIEQTKSSLAANNTNFRDHLSFATERLHSAIAWSMFLNQDGKKFNINNENLERACNQKIQEAQERVTYLSLIHPNLLGASSDDLETATQEKNNKNFGQCLHLASLSKAQADSILGVIGVEENHLDSLVNNRNLVAKQQIVKSANKGAFPILGYSYYEYANTLRKQDKYSALIYLQYALELSDLEIYFPNKTQENILNFNTIPKVPKKFQYLAVGIIIGIISGIIITLIVTPEQQKKITKRRKRNS
jgi:uncharacterized protein